VKAGIQLAHAGRKSSTYAPWLRDGLVSPPPFKKGDSNTCPPEAGGWTDVWAPSAIPFDENHITPIAMGQKEIDQVKKGFVDATKRACMFLPMKPKVLA